METYSNYESGLDNGASNTPQSATTGLTQEQQTQAWTPPEEFKGTPIDRFTSEKALCEAYLNLNNLLSKKREDFSLQDKQAFLQMREDAFGIPSNPQGYQIDTSTIQDPNNSYFDNKLNDSEIDFIKNLSSSLGLSNDQAQLGYDLINDFVGRAEAEQTQAVENYSLSNGNMLGEMWGEQNIDKCIADVATGISVAATAIGCDEQELKDELQHTMADLCCPHIVELFRQLAQLGGRGYGHGMSAGTTPMDARNQIEAIRNSPEWKNAMRNPTLKENQEIQQRMSNLVKMANGEL